MAEAQVSAGLSIGELSIKALGDISAGVDALRGDMKAYLLALERLYQEEGPTFVNLQGSGTTDSGSDPLVIDLGGPSYGQAWEVRQLVVGGLLWSTTVLGAANIVASPSPPIGVPTTAALQDHAPSLPSVAFYSSGQFRVRHPNRIYVVIVSGSASTPYEVAGDAFNVPDRPTRSLFTT